MQPGQVDQIVSLVKWDTLGKDSHIQVVLANNAQLHLRQRALEQPPSLTVDVKLALEGIHASCVKLATIVKGSAREFVLSVLAQCRLRALALP